MAKRKTNNSGKKGDELPKVHKELQGFDIKINSFGEITSTFDMDKINEFLNRNVEDKKLKDREDIPGKKQDEEDADEDLPLDFLNRKFDEEE
jgi:hypothetical protein